jgi:hypothetical protein
MMTEGDTGYVIWSDVHQAFWGPGRQGYVATLAQAGRYTGAEAGTICRDANRRHITEHALFLIPPAPDEGNPRGLETR